ncbi:trimethyllysine dioxygenase, mitochondrial [Danaus plexippus]|uniref:trimethyllysine dioxygenase, mitochondrial n=1 Tax=Danaus plexippus TaxID=13037 RepID=UPI002AB1B217|nr:trimethyllysine dioxygenase, mitochondrial [Danaus plexippus]
MSAITDVNKFDRALNIKFENGTSLSVEDCWLRDNCRCSSCYRSDTFQKANYLLELSGIKISTFKFDACNLYIEWNDKHQSTYEASFLIKFQYDKWKDSRKLRPILWKGLDIENKIARVHAREFLNTESGAITVFKSLIDYGVALIDQVGVSLEATEQVCKALGGVQHTLFGGMWQFTSVQDYADTAYTNLPLAVHNDNTYFNEAAGLQILHCLEHSNGEGGETILVDGFFGATKLKNEFPEDFEFLTNFNLDAEYLEDGHHYKYSAPVINVDKEKNLEQIRFNVYDRSPMAFSSGEECRSYYRALWNLSTYYQNTDCQWKFKLYPGLVMVMDNFRVLHGRTAFTGNRIICGSYVSRSDWLNKARALKLIQ